MGRLLMFRSMDEKLLAGSLPAVEGFVLSQAPKYLFDVAKGYVWDESSSEFKSSKGGGPNVK